MERQLGTLVAERPSRAEIEVVEELATAHPLLRVWAWRVLIAAAVLVALVGMIAWSSSPPT
jgi:hypothetical protein